MMKELRLPLDFSPTLFAINKPEVPDAVEEIAPK
jgi:hypothetical protein